MAEDVARSGGVGDRPARDDRTGTETDPEFERLLTYLREVRGFDFTGYKRVSLMRRVRRQMGIVGVESFDQYQDYLQVHQDEFTSLFNTILINVTGFFRDPEAFETLRTVAFPLMIKNKSLNSGIRVWVPGCSTGEEAYSLAIALLEFLGDRATNMQIQIFATDISDAIIQKARTGIYPESIAMDISTQRLKRFFQKADGGYQIGKPVRDICVFAKQDISKDPPFSKIDMISCRNVMIYMGPLLQKRIVPLFHYALNPTGVLFLGSSETVGGFGDFFTAVDKKYKIYTKKTADAPVNFQFVPQYDIEAEVPKSHQELPQRVDLQKAADQILLTRFAPASVVVNEKLDVLQFVGQTGRFLDPTPGDATLNLLRLVKGGLQLELRLAFQRIKPTGTVRKEGVLTNKAFHEPIDFLYFDLWHYYGRTAKHGAFMGGQDFAQWHGNYPILKHTVELKAQAEELRRAHGERTK